jgi:hypothetical protein
MWQGAEAGPSQGTESIQEPGQYMEAGVSLPGL